MIESFAEFGGCESLFAVKYRDLSVKGACQPLGDLEGELGMPFHGSKSRSQFSAAALSAMPSERRWETRTKGFNSTRWFGSKARISSNAARESTASPAPSLSEVSSGTRTTLRATIFPSGCSKRTANSRVERASDGLSTGRRIFAHCMVF